MFEPSSTARLFAVPLGADFPAAFVRGLTERTRGMAPHEIAGIDVFLSTRRMERRVRALLSEQQPCLLPRLRLLTDLATSPGLSSLPQPQTTLDQRLELRQLVRARLEARPDLAPLSSAFDLADSLAALMEEMHGEGVDISAFAEIDPAEHSEHWRRSLEFLNLIGRFFDPEARPSVEARQRAVVDSLIQSWETDPPQHPVLVAGSTGSRGTTARLMQAVAHLPNGAVILPGVDQDMPPEVLEALIQPDGAKDHPQFRLARFAASAGHALQELPGWSEPDDVNTARTALVNLALRPAPFTDAWLAEGPALRDLDAATSGLTLVEAQGDREEALAIAVAVRKALEEGKTAALITPDRRLTRRVAAALQSWRIRPDDSGGIPLHHVPTGRLVRQTAELMGDPPAPEDLLSLLKHPLVQRHDRGMHLLQTRDCELAFLRGGPRDVTATRLRDWYDAQSRITLDPDWLDWLCTRLDALIGAEADTLDGWVDLHIGLVETLVGEPGDTDPLWSGEEGQAVLKVLADLRMASGAAGPVSRQDYVQILSAMLAGEEQRDPVGAHPGVMIWGTLEARVQGADLVILSGLNDGIWPETATPDPWLNRAMRTQLGLFLPERRIGLSAHDFQQGILAPEVILTRAKRDAEAETVPSRWLNRLTSLMSGLPGSGQPALAAMQDRGDTLLALARGFDAPTTSEPPAKRPSPRPPVEARPTSLFVTRIETLIRDPYAIYARHILGLRPLDPLVAEPSAALRGQVIHALLEDFVRNSAKGAARLTPEALLQMAEEVFDDSVSWPATRALWLARVGKWADGFISREIDRQTSATPTLFEQEGVLPLGSIDFTLKGRADRIDLTEDGAATVYDYKTGQLPTQNMMDHFNKQIPLLALIVAEGGFPELDKRQIALAGFIGLGSSPKDQLRPYSDDDLAALRADLEKLIDAYRNRARGYSSRRALHETRWAQDYDHLARYGEWDETFEVNPEEVGP